MARISDRDNRRLIVRVKEVVDIKRFLGVWAGGILKCLSFPSTSDLLVGDPVLVTRIAASTEYFRLGPVCDDLPYGVIIIWSGTIAEIPINWALCDRAYGTGTPRLTARFPVGAGLTYLITDQGGTTTHNLNHSHAVTNTNSSLASSSHSHTMPATTSGGATPLTVGLVTDGGSMSQDHNHSVGPTTASGGSHTHVWLVPSNTSSFTGTFENRPVYRALVYMMHLGGDADFPIGSIHGWSGALGSVPSGYALCDGAGGTVDLSDYFVVCEGGGYAHNTTGGSNSKNMSHQHAGTTSGAWRAASESPIHGHTGGGTSGTTTPPNSPGGTPPPNWEIGPDLHNHIYSITGQTGYSGHFHDTAGNVMAAPPPVENRPLYYTLAFIQRMF